MCVSDYLYVCMCTLCVPGTCRNQNRALDFPELELQIVMSYCVDAENWSIHILEK